MTILAVFQIIVSFIIIGLILLQERSGGTSGNFGGGEGSFYQARRGLEKIAFIATIVLIVIFAALALLHLVVR